MRAIGSGGPAQLELIERASGNEPGLARVARLHLIEVGAPDPDEATSWLGRFARSLDWREVHFGPQRPAGTTMRFVQTAPGSITELMRAVRQAYPELFPDEVGSPWRRLCIRLYRLFQRTSFYQPARRWPIVQRLERWLGLIKPAGDENRPT